MVDISRLGTTNGAAADGSAEYALFLKVFSGEVLSTFQETNLFMDKHMVRTISSGKSAQFPVLGTASTKYMSPGDSIVETAGYLSQVKHNERVIHIDQFLTSNVMIADADELMNHYDVRSEYASAIGRALAKQMDQNIISTVYGAAATSETITGSGNGGTQLISGAETSAVTGANLISAAFDAAETLDLRDAPKEDRIMAVRPSEYYKLIEASGSGTSLVNRDYAAGNGGIADGNVFRVAGFQIVSTNNLNGTDTTATGSSDAGIRNDPSGGSGTGYQEGIAWDELHALFFHKSAVGTVKLADLSVESEYQLERLATLFVAKYMCGHGVLRPESAVSYAKAAMA
jgi:hypothetical protein